MGVRTAVKIFEWFRFSGRRMVFHRVLKAVFEAAWWDKRSSDEPNLVAVLLVRNYRTEAWWETLLATSSIQDRRKETCYISVVGSSGPLGSFHL